MEKIQEDKVISAVQKKLTGDEGLTEQDMTDYQQVPGTCPYCKGEQITTYQSPNVEGSLAYQTIFCLDCNKKWDDIYRLVGAYCYVKCESVFAIGEE